MVYALTVSLALICVALPLWMGARYGLVRFVSPMHLLGYFCGFGFLIKVTVFGPLPEYAFYRKFVDTPGALQLGAIYLSCFVLLICLGYRFSISPADPPPATGEIRAISAGIVRRGWLFSGAFAVAAFTFSLLLRARGLSIWSSDLLHVFNADKQIHVGATGVGATLAGVKTLFIVPKAAFVLLLAHACATGSRRSTAQAAILAALLVAIALISGDRFELVELLVFGCAVYLMLGGGIGFRSALIVAVASASVLFLSAYMTVLRGSDAGLLRQVVGSTYFLDINAAVMVTDRVQPSNYLLGQSYGWWSFGWVPRAFWPDKPAIDLGVFLKRDVMGVATGGAFNVTGPGEAFMNFGWGGMTVGFVLGWVYRRIEVALLAPTATLRFAAFTLYPLLFYPFIQGTLQSSFSGLIVATVVQAVMVVGLIATFVPRYRSDARPVNLGWAAHV